MQTDSELLLVHFTFASTNIWVIQSLRLVRDEKFQQLTLARKIRVLPIAHHDYKRERCPRYRAVYHHIHSWAALNDSYVFMIRINQNYMCSSVIGYFRTSRFRELCFRFYVQWEEMSPSTDTIRCDAESTRRVQGMKYANNEIILAVILWYAFIFCFFICRIHFVMSLDIDLYSWSEPTVTPVQYSLHSKNHIPLLFYPLNLKLFLDSHNSFTRLASISWKYWWRVRSFQNSSKM